MDMELMLNSSFGVRGCGSDDDPYFVGLNGKEYKLQHVAGRSDRPPYLVGIFSGDGLQVKIKPIKLVRKLYEEGSKKTEDDVVSVEYRVSVDVTDGTISKRIKGTLLYGW
jgi:hypothetical protein